MAIRFRDFFPEVKSKGFFTTEYESLKETVAQANDWLTHKGARILNVETVLLPNVGDSESTTESQTWTPGEMSSHWYQVVRVWYVVEDQSPT